MYKVYGITNCDTVKKAITWLKDHEVEFEFHDYKKLGISQQKVEEWLSQQPFEKLLNRAGTTWKKLPDEVKNSVVDGETAIPVMLEKTSAIKRPIIESDKIVALGFNAAEYENIFKS
ncbi:transcriptional regulator, Spx/MgsR family [Pseudarcicella hirudinis]|uniref:Transcriptional regulator, Spx/MgsR family n=1 Tax=Pseudarcicella hirudinis TaxID=1079859 RepID=A0A1I5S290_9BACT|nr:Spx/MgsR family RNA polymerase-binding regulatory protein [Pseudarcicella hirudinis]SFP64701.1 transcriptional regulator, Spx/MgsR family [Pseudarcicella hirudinis]